MLCNLQDSLAGFAGCCGVLNVFKSLDASSIHSFRMAAR
jgi:hypothetical protein